ncbi:MAG: hypothetical protein ABWX84_12200 [Nocardioides sp.]
MELIAPVVLATAVALSLLGWRLPTRGQVLVAGALVLLLATAASLALAELHEDDSDNIGLVLAGVLAVLGGGVVTSSVFGLVDGMSPDDASVRKAGEVLRGGAWIGALERLAVFVTVLAGWPEGLAVTLALKGLGRYPELRTETPGAAERFIIGTFTSVLWAVACAGAAITMA